MEFHILCKPEDIAPYVFVPGDHDRAKKIADHFDNAHFVSDSRGYRIYTGSVNGVPMTVCSTGMGGPQVAIGVEELAHLGARVFIRVGSCGTSQPNVGVGDVIIPTGVFRGGATANRYLPPAFPAAPNFDVLSALVEEGRAIDPKLHVGIAAAGDAFYAEGDAGLFERITRAGVIGIEMECDTLFVISNFRGWRSGAILACDGTASEIKPEWGRDAFLQGEERAIQIAIRAMHRIALQDQQQSA